MTTKDQILALLNINFTESPSYTREELEAMSPEELEDCYQCEFGEEEEECIVCQQITLCPCEDEETGGPVCQTCADEAILETTPEDEDAASENQDDEEDTNFDFEDDEDEEN
jgi:hypothetical protein